MAMENNRFSALPFETTRMFQSIKFKAVVFEEQPYAGEELLSRKRGKSEWLINTRKNVANAVFS